MVTEKEARKRTFIFQGFAILNIIVFVVATIITVSIMLYNNFSKESYTKNTEKDCSHIAQALLIQKKTEPGIKQPTAKTTIKKPRVGLKKKGQFLQEKNILGDIKLLKTITNGDVCVAIDEVKNFNNEVVKAVDIIDLNLITLKKKRPIFAFESEIEIICINETRNKLNFLRNNSTQIFEYCADTYYTKKAQDYISNYHSTISILEKYAISFR